MAKLTSIIYEKVRSDTQLWIVLTTTTVLQLWPRFGQTNYHNYGQFSWKRRKEGGRKKCTKTTKTSETSEDICVDKDGTTVGVVC